MKEDNGTQMTFTQSMLIEFARQYSEYMFGECTKEVYYTRFGMLVDFIGELFDDDGAALRRD